MRTMTVLAAAVVAGVCSAIMGVAPAHAIGSERTVAVPAAFPDNEVEIVNDHAGKCLDVTDGSTDIGTPIQEWSCHGRPEQLWRKPVFSDGVFPLISVNSNGLCLDIAANVPQDGDRVVQYPCAYWWYGSNLRTTQMWRWEAAQGFGEWLVNVYSGLCLAMSPNTSANGTSIVVGACGTTTAKYWHVETG